MGILGTFRQAKRTIAESRVEVQPAKVTDVQGETWLRIENGRYRCESSGPGYLDGWSYSAVDRVFGPLTTVDDLPAEAVAEYTGPAPETVGAEWFTAEQVALAYAYGRRDEHFHPVRGACLSEVFAAFAQGADVSDFQRIYDQLAQGDVA